MAAWNPHDDLAELRADLDRDEQHLDEALSRPDWIPSRNASEYIALLERDVNELRRHIEQVEAGLEGERSL
jgi:hypothetical protein